MNLIAALCLLLPLALAGDSYETILFKEDLGEIEVRARRVTTLPESFQNKAGHVILCEQGACSVSCEPRSDMDGPDASPEEWKSLTGKPCWIGIRPVHIKTYLALIEKAGKSKKALRDPMKIATCDAAKCTLKTPKSR